MEILHISKDDGTETFHSTPQELAGIFKRLARYFGTDEAGVEQMFHEVPVVETDFSLYRMIGE